MCTWWVGKRRNKFRYPARVMLCVRPTKGQQHDTLAYTVLVPMTVICDMLANNIELINENFKVLRLRASIEGGAMQGKWRRPWQRVLLTSPSSNTIKQRFSEAQHLNLNELIFLRADQELCACEHFEIKYSLLTCIPNTRSRACSTMFEARHLKPALDIN